jgi:hypothetical protein
MGLCPLCNDELCAAAVELVPVPVPVSEVLEIAPILLVFPFVFEIAVAAPLGLLMR